MSLIDTDLEVELGTKSEEKEEEDEIKEGDDVMVEEEEVFDEFEEVEVSLKVRLPNKSLISLTISSSTTSSSLFSLLDPQTNQIQVS